MNSTTRNLGLTGLSLTLLLGTVACGGTQQALIPVQDIKTAYAQVTVCPRNFAPALQLKDKKQIEDPDCAAVNADGTIANAPFLAGSQKQYGVVFLAQPNGTFKEVEGWYYDPNDIEPVGNTSKASEAVQSTVINGFAQQKVRTTSGDASDYKKITGVDYGYSIKSNAEVQQYQQGLKKLFGDRYQYDITMPISATNQPQVPLDFQDRKGQNQQSQPQTRGQTNNQPRNSNGQFTSPRNNGDFNVPFNQLPALKGNSFGYRVMENGQTRRRYVSQNGQKLNPMDFRIAKANQWRNMLPNGFTQAYSLNASDGSYVIVLR